jgi:predicted nuclease of predicted toxin-antitoxin system
VKLLLDEMISPKIARELRGKGEFDVQAVKGDRPDLQAVADREIVRRIAAEQRTLVTNDVLDFQLIHNQMLAAGEDHYGLIFSSDSTMPRNKASIPLWVKALAEVLTEHPANDALKNRVRHLPQVAS